MGAPLHAYASLGVQIPKFKLGYPYTCMLALVPLYLYADLDAPNPYVTVLLCMYAGQGVHIFIYNPGCSYTVCKPEGSFISTQAFGLLYSIGVSKATYGYRGVQACILI